MRIAQVDPHVDAASRFASRPEQGRALDTLALRMDGWARALGDARRTPPYDIEPAARQPA
ncbi:hypothetical protein SALB1_2224 [Salinisphaera sp. LB1]|nr:hypothetical protein SALB1_2224 [Salinisphaera sp. LB1]